jgi:two-component system, NarL family, response regulator LiaR
MRLRSILYYGFITGVLVLTMQLLQFRTIVRDIPIELFGVVIGIIFLVVGIWLGMALVGKKSLAGKHAESRLGLSSRELEVLQLMASGLSNQQIADKLFVSTNTIKTHVASIFAKLVVDRRTQAIQKARELKIIE